MKAVQWFTIGGTSPPSRLTIGWSKTQLLSSLFCKLWTTALPSMTGIWCFSSFYRWIIKLLYLFLHLPNQISPLNHNCNALNVFFTVLSHDNARSENGQSILWPFSQPGFLELLRFLFFCRAWDSQTLPAGSHSGTMVPWALTMIFFCQIIPWKS